MKHAKAHTSRRLRCLIVDDEPQARDTIMKLLARYYPEAEVVGEAASVDEAVQRIAALGPDVVFLDIEISGGTGFDVLDRIDSTRFTTVFITAYENYRTQSARYQNAKFLLKPVSISLLGDALHALSETSPAKEQQR